MNVFKEMVYAVGKPSAYLQFLKNKGGKVFGYGILLLLYFVWITALFFLGVLLVTLPGLILNNLLKTNLKFGQIFVLALYGRTLPLMFKGIVVRMCDMLLFRVNIPFFWVLNFGATLIYMYLAMKKIEEQRYSSISYTY